MRSPAPITVLLLLFVKCTVAVAAGLEPPHDVSEAIGCISCHQMTSTYPKLLPPLNHTPSDIDDTLANNVCWSCHNDTIAPFRLTHSSQTTSSKYGSWTVECWVCHSEHRQEQIIYNGSSYGKFIRRAVNLAHIAGPAKTGLKPVKLLRPTGPNSFADGDATVDGVCEVCHTDTTAWHNDGSLAGTQAHTGLKGSNCTSCHPHDQGFKPVYDCLDCHQNAISGRAAVGQQLGGNSHHIQGVAATGDRCHQCHWEADETGKLTSYHGATPGSPVDLVIYGSGTRPAVYTLGGTAVAYTADGSRTQILGLNDHCLGCHRDENNATQPFGDGKTPRQYAWDGNSVAARYAQTTTTPWGKYSGANVSPKNTKTKAYSAHGNAVSNQGGWDLNETWPNTRGGGTNVACFDCHNAHGSSATGTTSTYASATVNGGILKDTAAGKGGYGVDYKPVAGGSVANKNLRNAGASLCFDCHLSPDGSAAGTPWGYQVTFGASQPIIGYFDSPYLAPGSAGTQQRYPYKGLTQIAGGHFGASSPLATMPLHSINGLCASCHDPHGVSPTDVGLCSNTAFVNKSACQSGGGTWTATPGYGVPLLKGTWLTSPYLEDASPQYNVLGTVRDNTYPLGHDGAPREGVKYHIDQNTFGANIRSVVAGVTEPANQFAGLCLNCHPKSSLTDGSNGGTWKSVDRIHESVKGWGANVRHKYTCSKCHTPHNGSALPRLMVTNCLNRAHKGRAGNNTSPVLFGSGNCDDGNCYGEALTLGFGWWEELYAFASGGGQFPGSWSGYYPGSYSVSCHEARAADQSWNTVTPWVNNSPAITSGPKAAVGSQHLLLHMDENAWNGTWNEVVDSSGLNNHATAYNGATTVAGGITGRAGSFNGTGNYVRVNYSPPADNFTIEAWLKPTTTHEIDPEATSGTSGTSGQRYLFGADQRGSDGGAGVSAGTNGISVYEHGNSYMPALAVYSGAISSTEWTHLAVVYMNKRPSIYLNGVLVRTGLQSTKPHVYAPTWVGGGAYGLFPGLVDEVAIFNSALNGAKIMKHFQMRSSTVCNVDSAVITWQSDHAATSHVEYGPTSSYGSSIDDSSPVTAHSITLSGLTVPGTYHYRVSSTNTDGESVSGDHTFTLNSCPLIPPILSAPTATGATSSNATLGATIDVQGDAPITARGTVWGTSPSPTGNGVAEGGTGTGAFSHLRSGLPAGTKIFYRGYATSAAGTGYSPDGSFHTEPETQASAVNFTTVGSASMNVNWTRGSGDGVIVLMKQGAAVSTAPADGTYSAYTANSQFGSGSQIGSGNFVIAKGNVSSVSVTGLTASTAYHVAVYEYKAAMDTAGVHQGVNYKTPPATASQVTGSGGTLHTFTFNYTGTMQTLDIPAGATDVQFTVKGAGGGGGREDGVQNQQSGQNGHLVSLLTATSGITLTIYVGGGGSEGSTTPAGSTGGWGYHAGGTGGDGEDYTPECDEWAYGGAGGGGSSAIRQGVPLLVEAAGGAGGRSSDWDGDCYYTVGGAGGTGGGADFPGTTNPTGGGAGGSSGASPTAGGNGQVTVSYIL